MTLRLFPHTAFLWSQCSMSARALSKEVGGEKTLDQLEGLAAHEYLEHTLHGVVYSSGDMSTYGVSYSEEMILGAQEVLSDIARENKTLDITRGIQPFRIEHPVSIPTVHSECSGRADACRIDPSNKAIYVWEYKFGHGFVSEINNPSGVLLAEGLFLEANVPPADRKNWNIRYALAQPRCFDPRTRGRKLRVEEYSGAQHSLRVQALREQAQAAELEPEAVPNESCSKCPDALGCSALQATSALICDISLTLGSSDLTFEEMDFELKILQDAKRRIEAREDALTAAISEDIRNGKVSRNFSLEAGLTTTVWSKSENELSDLQKLLSGSINLFSPPKPLTFKQASLLPENQKLIASGFFETLKKEQSGKVRLVRKNHQDANRAFSKKV